MATSKYIYQPISAPRAIRLISLQPSSASDAELKCSFSVVSLTNKPSFKALSYTWGEDIFSDTLLCDDGALDITPNLHAALKRLRLIDKPFELWIDALCINQSDDDEKSHQIPLMASIYSQASEVIIWLGESDEDSDEVMRFLQRTGQKFLDRGGPILEPRDERSSRNDAIWDAMIQDPCLQKMSMIWSRSWFSRRWVVQEVALAQRAVVYCGGERMDWDVLTTANMAAIRLGSDGSKYWKEEMNSLTLLRPALRVSSSANLSKLKAIRNEVQANVESERRRIIHTIFGFARGFECRDAKDYAFALLALFNCGRTNPLQIEYSKPTALVYLELAKYYAQNDMVIDILSFAGKANHATITDDSLDLPSWRPDWRLPFRRPSDVLSRFDAGCRLSSSVSFSLPHQRLFKPTVSSFREDNPSPKKDVSKKLGPLAFMSNSHLAAWYEQVETIINLILHVHWPEPHEYILGDLWDALAKTLILDFDDIVFDWCRDTERGRRLAREGLHEPLWTQWKGFNNRMLQCAVENRSNEEVVEDSAEPKIVAATYEQMEYVDTVEKICEDRCFYITGKGIIGLGPKGSKPGDVLVVLAGSSVPHVVRPEAGFCMVGESPWFPVMVRREAVIQMPDGSGTRPIVMRVEVVDFTLLGEAYAHGLMNDEVWGLPGLLMEEINIV